MFRNIILIFIILNSLNQTVTAAEVVNFPETKETTATLSTTKKKIFDTTCWASILQGRCD